jgi:hypothetical protein
VSEANGVGAGDLPDGHAGEPTHGNDERRARRDEMVQEALQYAEEIRSDPGIYWMEVATMDRRAGMGERLLRERYDVILNDEDLAELMMIEPPEYDDDGDSTTTEDEWEIIDAQEKQRQAQIQADPHGYWLARAELLRRRHGTDEAALRLFYGRQGLIDERLRRVAGDRTGAEQDRRGKQAANRSGKRPKGSRSQGRPSRLLARAGRDRAPRPPLHRRAALLDLRALSKRGGLAALLAIELPSYDD